MRFDTDLVNSVRALASAIFQVLGIPGALVFGDNGYRSSERFNREAEGDHAQLELDAQEMFDELGLHPDPDESLVRTTPIEVPEGNTFRSCGRVGGVSVGERRLAVATAITGDFNRVIATPLLWGCMGHSIVCLPELRTIDCGEGTKRLILAFEVSEDEMLLFLKFARTVCGENSLTVSLEGFCGVFSQTIQPGVPSGFIIGAL